jgi:hypothetical protein
MLAYALRASAGCADDVTWFLSWQLEDGKDKCSSAHMRYNYVVMTLEESTFCFRLELTYIGLHSAVTSTHLTRCRQFVHLPELTQAVSQPQAV